LTFVTPAILVKSEIEMDSTNKNCQYMNLKLACSFPCCLITEKTITLMHLSGKWCK